MCDEIAIINQGELVARDTTANLLGRLDAKAMVVHPAHPVTALPVGDGIASELRGDGVVILRYHGNRTRAEEVLSAVREAGISIRDVKTEEADLEDVFLALTKSRS